MKYSAFVHYPVNGNILLVYAGTSEVLDAMQHLLTVRCHTELKKVPYLTELSFSIHPVKDDSPVSKSILHVLVHKDGRTFSSILKDLPFYLAPKIFI